MANSRSEPCVIPGQVAVDDRGQLSFVQAFTFEGVRRFYVVENFSMSVIRAFHGHLQEQKYVLAVAGSALVLIVQFDDAAQLPAHANLRRYVLSARHPSILWIPAGYANGFRALEPGTKLIFFSTATLEESSKDDYRFPFDHWGAHVWDVQNR